MLLDHSIIIAHQNRKCEVQIGFLQCATHFLLHVKNPRGRKITAIQLSQLMDLARLPPSISFLLLEGGRQPVVLQRSESSNPVPLTWILSSQGPPELPVEMPSIQGLPPAGFISCFDLKNPNSSLLHVNSLNYAIKIEYIRRDLNISYITSFDLRKDPSKESRDSDAGGEVVVLLHYSIASSASH